MAAITERARTELDLPIVIVDQSTPGLARFLDQLGECVVVFDEFEKNFRYDEEGEHEKQEDLLGLFDGTSSVKRLYLITANNVNALSDFLINRPGRFHYHIRFDVPDANSIREYLADMSPEACEEDVDKIVNFSRRFPMNYDALRAISTELADGERFDDFIDDLNIKNINVPRTLLSVTIKYTDGTHNVQDEHFDLFSDKYSFYAMHPTFGSHYRVWVSPSEIEFNSNNVCEGIEFTTDEEGQENIESIDFAIKNPSNFTYSGKI